MTTKKRRFTEGLLNTERIVKELNLSPGQTAIDAGCGTGYMARRFVQEVGESGYVYAFDINETYITELNELYSEKNFQAQICNIAESMPVGTDSVDVVYISTVLHSRSKEQVNVFEAEVKRILNPNGILAVVEIAKHQTPFGPPLKQRYSPKELQAEIAMKPLGTIPVAEHFYMQLFQN